MMMHGCGSRLNKQQNPLTSDMIIHSLSTGHPLRDGFIFAPKGRFCGFSVHNPVDNVNKSPVFPLALFTARMWKTQGIILCFC